MNVKSHANVFTNPIFYCVYLPVGQSHRYRVGNQNWMAINVLILDYIRAHGQNTISASMVSNYAVAKFHRFYRTNIKIRRCRARCSFGRRKMCAMKSEAYRLHSHLKMAPERKNKMLKVGKQQLASNSIQFNQTKWLPIENVCRQSGDNDF